MKTLNLKYFGVTILIVRGYMMSSVTWPLDSAPLWKFKVPKILGSRPWPFGVTWCHRPRDHRTRRGYFSIGGQWWPCIYLALIRRYEASKILGSRVWPFGSMTWRHRSRDHGTRHMWFSISGPLEPCVYLAPLRRYKASKLRLPMLKAKISLRMLRVTWPVGRGPKLPHIWNSQVHIAYSQLLWG